MKIEQPETILEFQRMFPDEGACAAYLAKIRWEGGFSCAVCGVADDAQRVATRPRILRCRHCGHEVSLTAGTVMHRTRIPLQVWFWGAYLVVTQTPGMSARQFQRQLGLNRYETAFQLLHKLRAGMVRPEQDRIGDHARVEVDETLIGGRTRGEGRGVHHKIYVAGAVEVREKLNKHGHRSLYAGRLRLQTLTDRMGASLDAFVTGNVLPHSHITTDGWAGYSNLTALGYQHAAIALNGDMSKADQALPLIHLVFANLKAWVQGTHHSVSQQHLPAYLNEFVFRFNRRFYPMTSFATVLGICVNAAAPTYRELYDAQWDYHPHLFAYNHLRKAGVPSG